MYSKDIIKYFERIIKNRKFNFENVLLRLEKKFSERDIVTCYNYILLNKTDTSLLNYTIKRINKLKYDGFLPSLIDFILKPALDTNLKVLAIKTSAVFKNKDALNTLLFCLHDKNSNYKIRLAAADALGKIGGENAFIALGNVLEDENENSAYVKESAATALGAIGDIRALDVFSSILSDKKMFLNKFIYLKERIIEAVSKFDISRNDKALNILKTSLLEPESALRISAIETIMNSNLNNAFDLIYERLQYDDDIEVKKNALIALYNISDKRILYEVIEGDFNIELKNYARQILKEYEEDEQ